MLTKEQFLARCATAYDMGHIRPETITLLNKWLDFVLRFEGGQVSYVADFLEEEKRRTNWFGPGRTLAGDADGYALVYFAAILGHPCQKCAEDREQWHTRPAFCNHSAEERQPVGVPF